MIEVACALIRNAKNEFLLVRRSSKMEHPLQWEFPGGKLKAGEDAFAAIQREIWEEIAIEVVPIEKLEVVVWEYPNKKIGLIPIICVIRSGKLHLNEHCGSIWLRIDAMGDLDLLAADRAILKQLNTRS